MNNWSPDTNLRPPSHAECQVCAGNTRECPNCLGTNREPLPLPEVIRGLRRGNLVLEKSKVWNIWSRVPVE